MKEIDIKSLTKEDAETLDKLLSACAEAAVKEAQRKVTAKEKREEGYDRCIAEELDEEGLALLYGCYCRSKFAYPDVKHRQRVNVRLGEELSRILPTNKLECFGLLFPIMAYTLLINNEFNFEAVRKRVRNDSKKDSQGSMAERNVWGHTELFKICRSTNFTKVSEIDKYQQEFALAFECADDEQLCDNPGVLETAGLLKECELIIRLQDLGKIASFLLEIIVDSYDHNNPMETLVRFYLANRMDNIMIRCRNFPENIYRDKEEQVTVSNILLRYWQDKESSNSEDNVHLGVEIPEDWYAMGFGALYQKVANEFTISEDSLNTLLRFYLNPDRLERMCTLWDRCKDFVKAVIKDLNSCAQTTKRTAEWDLEMVSEAIWQKELG